MNKKLCKIIFKLNLFALTLLVSACGGNKSTDNVTPNSGTKSSENTELGTGVNNPVPFGTPIIYDGLDQIDAYKVEFTLLDVIRGEDAWQIIQEEYPQNAYHPALPPTDGKEYILIKIKAKTLEYNDNNPNTAIKPFFLSFADFSLVSKERIKYKDGLHDLYNDHAELYVGMEINHDVFGLINQDDTPSFVFGEGYRFAIWFSTE